VDLSNYHLTFDDEFNSFSASPNGSGTTWETKYWWGGRSLGSNDFYLDPSVGGLGETPYSTVNGALVVHAQPTTPELQAAGVTQPFTTGQIDTHNSFSQEYGYFEMRAQISNAYGTNNAFWLMPMSGPWPPEIDVTEVLGRDPKTDFMTNHTDSTNPTSYGGTYVGVDLSQGYHTYGLMWTPTTLTFYLDGVARYTTATQPDEHQPMYMLATLGVGGSWPGNPDPTNFSADMKIDYIRAYSSDSAIAAISLQPISSPDGVDTTPYGAITADGVLQPGGAAASDSITSASSYTLDGTSHNLTLIGTSDIDGTGNALDNVIIGNAGSNIISGASGNDVLMGMDGNDTFSGGAGEDTLSYANDPSGVAVQLSLHWARDGWGHIDTIVDMDHLIGSPYSDDLLGDAGSNRISGGDGRDSLRGFAGTDVLDGGSGVDEVSFARDPNGIRVDLKDGYSVDGWGDHDTLINLENVEGSVHNDVIVGSTGNNTIAGRAGDDVLMGLGGQDVFLHQGHEGHDTILDFEAGPGLGDRIFVGSQNGGLGVSTFAGVLAHATDTPDGVLIDFGGGDTITLSHLTKAQLAPDDFLFG
jgi:beta-glucanase (GH16 family)